MTDVAAVVAAAAGSRGIGFQGNLVRFLLLLQKVSLFCVMCHAPSWCVMMVGSWRHHLYMRQSSYIQFK